MPAMPGCMGDAGADVFGSGFLSSPDYPAAGYDTPTWSAGQGVISATSTATG